MRTGLQSIWVLLLFCGLPGAVRAEGIDLEEGREFWAFKRPVRAELPEVADPAWAQSPIDRFVRAKLEEEDRPVPAELGKAKLVRRVYFDLHGLPPSPEQLAAALADESRGAFETLVDGLLASPRFGERWGRHWLDLVRFSESTGGGRTMLLEHSWRYRDYVVDAFNQDKPYDEFLTEQLAGDLLPSTDPATGREHLIATSFLALGPSNYELQDKELLTMEIVDEQVDTVGRAFMAMTLGCARCHDHMFDPISARDYYALAGIFHSTKTVEHANVSKWLMADLPPVTPVEKHAAGVQAVYRKRLEMCREKIAEAERELAEIAAPEMTLGVIDDADEGAVAIEGKWVGSTSVKNWVGSGYLHDGDGEAGLRRITFRPPALDGGRYEIRVAYSAGGNRSSRTPVKITHAGGETALRIDQRQPPEIGGQFVSLGIYEFEAGNTGSVEISNQGSDGVTIADAVQWLPVSGAPVDPGLDERRQDLDERLAALHEELEKISKSAPQAAQARTMRVQDQAKPSDVPLSIRGDVHSPGELVPRGFPEVIVTSYRPTFSDKGSGRLELARWLTAEDHPLTARVLVNRLWAKLMGEGLVRTPDNFGMTGELPSDPELLDWLALRLIENGWSMKQMLREMILTRSYRSERVEPRRLDAEALRDAILFVSGRLDPSIGGASIRPGTKSEFGYDFASERRSLYLPVFRNALPDLFSVFDFPDPNLVAGERNTSTLATQALYFMNHRFVIEQSEHAAKALLRGEEPAVEDRVQVAYLRSLGRLPSATEAALAQEFLGDSPTLSSWSAFFQSLFACVDFRYVD
ncbi:MAG: DUF1549 domain-containing protein [Verrucomicrobiales bacterium]